MLTIMQPTPSNEPPPLSSGSSDKFDWTARLSIDAIRSHTKTDDVPGVTDEQLTLYRAAAIEAAEKYTGLLLSGQRTVTEAVQTPQYPKPGRMTYKHRLQYPSADGLVYLYGGPDPSYNRTFRVTPGSRMIQVPIVKDFIDLSCPCNPCATAWHLNGGMMCSYKAGYKCADEVPSGIVLGCLQYIAWVIEHPGDELITQRNRLDHSLAGVSGSNNIASASGAIEQWRQYDDSAI